MKKLKLELDALTVESFETVRKERAARGTVRGHVDSSCGQVCTCASCPDENTFPQMVAFGADPLFAAIVETDQPNSCMDSAQDC